jgi:hypothetical protein
LAAFSTIRSIASRLFDNYVIPIFVYAGSTDNCGIPVRLRIFIPSLNASFDLPGRKLSVILPHLLDQLVEFSVQRYSLNDGVVAQHAFRESALKLAPQFGDSLPHVCRPDTAELILAIWKKLQVLQDNTHVVALYLILYLRGDTYLGKPNKNKA